MAAYRFCRSDDIALLSDALNRCWLPYFPDEPPMTPATFKRSIRDLQVWSSSCMVAFSGSDPIGVLIGAKRPSGTLIHKIAVHPDHPLYFLIVPRLPSQLRPCLQLRYHANSRH